MSQNSTDNTALFQPSGSSPRYREEASRSWWMEPSCREEFQAAAERERIRMARSRAAKQVAGYTIGWSLPKSRRSL